MSLGGFGRRGEGIRTSVGVIRHGCRGETEPSRACFCRSFSSSGRFFSFLTGNGARRPETVLDWICASVGLIAMQAERLKSKLRCRRGSQPTIFGRVSIGKWGHLVRRDWVHPPEAGPAESSRSFRARSSSRHRVDPLILKSPKSRPGASRTIDLTPQRLPGSIDTMYAQSPPLRLQKR